MKFEDYRVFKTAIGGRLLEVEIGKVCEKANGQAMVKYGDTVVNVTATASEKPRADIDFFPLSVDFEERMYAAGKIPGGFIRREGRPSEKAILTSRLIDRPIRPLFPKGFYNDVQVVCTAMSIDPDCTPESVAMIGSSIALTISDIPWDGPTASVVIGYINGNYVVNPTQEQRAVSELHLVVSGTKDAIMMVEAGANEVKESVMLEAILFAHEQIKQIVSFIEDIQREVGKEKRDYDLYEVPAEIVDAVNDFAAQKMYDAVHVSGREERTAAMAQVETDTMEALSEKFEGAEKDIANALYALKKEKVRNLIIDDEIRPDDRKRTEVRPIWCDTSVLPRVHGSGLFKRGETQVLSAATLGGIGDAQVIDGIGVETEKRYMHHYNFPPYSVGEARPIRSPGRREIGHGALAERALLPVLPSKEDFPYTIRVVSDVLSSNGSTSQASVCGSCMALMDAGVPIKAPVAGIAMGLIERVEEDGSSKMAILSDIQGLEDFLGDMDFKVAGTKEGITAIQMDIKVHGLSKEVLSQALEQAREGRLHIMGEMLNEIDAPRAELSKYAPRIITMKIDPEQVRVVIGPGGKTINKITQDTGAKLDLEDDGTVFITAPDMESAYACQQAVELLTKDVEVGEVYEGEVKRIMAFGAFIEVLPGKEGLLHISKMADYRVDKVEDVMNLGDKVKVKVKEIDDQGRINLIRG